MKKEVEAARTVLVIDDSQVVLDVTRTALEEAGFRVMTRNSATGSVGAILTEKPDVVLLDLNMPVLSGEAIARIVGRPNSRSNSIVLLHSSLPVETLRLKAASAGAHGYISKSESPADLARRIEYWILKSLGTVSARARDAQAHDDPPVRPSMAPQPQVATPWQRPRTQALRGPKTLFIDDDWTTLRGYRTIIGSALDAEYVTSGEEALGRLFSASPPDIVVCDIVMPFVSGAEVYRRAVSADPSWTHRFLFLTGASSTRTVIDLIGQLDGRVLYKPVPHNRLLEAIRQVQSELGPRPPSL